MINVFQPDLGAAEAAAVAEVLESGWVGRGPRTEEFEARFAEHLEVPADRVTSTNSCSEGLFLAMELAGVGPGDEVVLPTISFVGAGNAVASRGARPVFCDVDTRGLNPTVADVEAAMSPRTRAVIVLHYGGAPGDVVGIAELCRRRGVLLVEDAACAVASRVDDRAVGTVGDIGLWSFDGAKVVVTGDGGMLTARDPELVARARKLAYFGLEQTSGFSQAAAASRRWWDFQISSFSRRSITNDIAAAIGLVQLERLPDLLRRREEIARRYDALLAGSTVVCPPPLPAGHATSNYFYWVQLPAGRRDEVARRLLEEDVYTTFRYAPLHRVDAYGWDGGPLPGAERAADRTLCLPIHSSLSDDDVDLVAKILLDAVPAPSTEEDSR